MLKDYDFSMPEEVRMQQVISDVDRYYAAQGLPRERGKRVGMCFIISDNVKARASAAGLDLRTVEVADIHRPFGFREFKFFQHGFNITSDLSQLIDLTFCQFVDEDGKISQGKLHVSGTLDSVPGLELLMRDGVMPLNDENLRQYLKATTFASDRSYIESATVEALRGQRLT